MQPWPLPPGDSNASSSIVTTKNVSRRCQMPAIFPRPVRSIVLNQYTVYPLVFFQHLQSGVCHVPWLPRREVGYMVTSIFFCLFLFLTSICNISPHKRTCVVAHFSSYYGGHQGRSINKWGPSESMVEMPAGLCLFSDYLP